MKKIVMIIILLFMPIFVKGSSLNKLYIDSEMDITGNLLVREIVEFDFDTKDPINIYYRNEIDSLHKSSAIILKKVGILDDIKNIKDFYNDDFTDKHINFIEEYNSDDDNEYLNIYFDNREVYYLEYIILNVSVKYNDASEFYFKYLYNFNYDIKEGIILFRLPYKSNMFNVYTHSNSKVKVNIDKEHSIVKYNFNSFKKDKYLDTRIIFDKDIFTININKDKYINSNILDIINKQEKNTNSNNNNIIIYIIICLFILLTISIIYSHFKIDITNYNIKDKRIDKNIKLLVLSDLHDRRIENKLLKILENEKPDYVVMSGDMIDGNYFSNKIANKRVNRFVKFCEKLDNYNVLYTFGNHETFLKSELFNKYKNKLSNTKIRLLNNDGIYLSKKVKLTGIFYSRKYYDRKKYPLTTDFIHSKIGNINNKNYNIIVCHNPLTPEPFSEIGFDMMISGHIHGGVIRIPFALLSPEYRLFPKYSNGLYNINKMKLLVSRGLGYCKNLKIRVNNPAHIMIINLEKDEDMI